jgi:hypothetical protein
MNIPVADILAGTPYWVWLLFAFLMYGGFRRLSPSVRRTDRIWITPGIFVAWGLIGLFGRQGALAASLSNWMIGAAVGLALGLVGELKMEIDDARGLSFLPSSTLPLIRVLLIFGGHYALNVAAALHPVDRAMYMGWDLYVSGASAGYFGGWMFRFHRTRMRAPRVDLGSRLTGRA